MLNLSLEFLDEEELNLLDRYDGLCHELAADVADWIGYNRVQILWIESHPSSLRARLLYEPSDNQTDVEACSWDFHVVPIIDGVVHDAWHPTLLLQPLEYMSAAFPGQEIVGKIYDCLTDEHDSGIRPVSVVYT